MRYKGAKRNVVLNARDMDRTSCLRRYVAIAKEIARAMTTSSQPTPLSTVAPPSVSALPQLDYSTFKMNSNGVIWTSVWLGKAIGVYCYVFETVYLDA